MSPLPAVCRQASAHANDKNDEMLLDLVDRGGSYSSESLSSRPGRRNNDITTLACRLREHHSGDAQASVHGSQSKLETLNWPPKIEEDGPRRRPNTCFHHFRFLVVIFGGISVGMMLFFRYSITVSVLKMVNQTHLYLEEHPGKTIDDMIADGHIPGGEFNWNNEVQQLIMASYMIAYTLPQLALSKIGIIMGSRMTTSLSLALCALSSLLTPMFAYFGWEYVIILRLLNGFGAAPILPMLIHLLENWLREEEISMGLSLSQAVTFIINSTNPLVSGYLSSIHWSLSFYIPGAIALLFCLIWMLLMSDGPQDNFLVSQQEFDHIMAGQKGTRQKTKSTEIEETIINEAGQQKSDISSITKVTIDQEAVEGDEHTYKPNSWTALLRVPSFYAYLLLWCIHCCTFNAFNFILPSYLTQFLRIEVAQNGLFCSMIITGSIIAVIWPHPTLKMLQTKFGLSDKAARRLALTICCAVVALTWIVVGLYHEFQLILLFLNRCTQNGIDVITTSTLMFNYADSGLSSMAFSAMNTVGNLSVVFSSSFLGWFLDYTGQSRAGWCMIYVGLGSVQLIVWLLYVFAIPLTSIKFKRPADKQ